MCVGGWLCGNGHGGAGAMCPGEVDGGCMTAACIAWCRMRAIMPMQFNGMQLANAAGRRSAEC